MGSMSRGRRGRAVRIFQGITERSAGCFEGGSQSKEDAATDADHERKQQHSSVNPDLVESGHLSGTEGQKSTNGKICEQQSEDAAQKREHGTLCEQLPDYPFAARA